MTSQPAGESMRLFVGLELPEAWLQALAEVQERMQAAINARLGPEPPRIRWTRPEGIHLTLKFLGQTASEQLAAIDRALRQAVDGAEPFSLVLGEAGSFSDRRGPRVLFVTVDGETLPMQTLAKRVDAALARAGFAREKRPFQPHLTLARLPEDILPAVRERIGQAIAGVQPPQPGVARFEELSLMRSYLERGGARYERADQYRLGPG